MRDRIGGDVAPPAADSIEEGKRLVRVQTGGLSLADRLSEHLHRLTWRTPLHSLRLKGRHPLKLMAVPEDPILGDIERGHALLGGVLDWRGEERGVESIDFARPDWSTGFADHLHSFAWLRDLSSVATRQQGAPIAEYLMGRWLDAFAETVDATAWRPDLWGRRILFWTAHAPLILSSTDLVYRSRVLNTMARGARHLDRGADKAPAGVARIASWCGVIAAGLLLAGGDPRQAFGETGLSRALDTGLFADGGVIARSPSVQLDAVMLLTMMREVYDARGLAFPDPFQARLQKMISALLGVMHGDRALSSWQGSGPETPEKIAAVIEASGVRTRPLRQAGDWGYQRLAAAQAVLVMDAAPPPIARAIEGGCASTLAFEFSDGAQRIVVNCGGARATVAQVPASLAHGLRTTAAHSTLTLGDSNSTAIHADGTLGRGVAEVELSRQESDAASRIEASHDGYVRRYGFTHRRQLLLTGDGRELRGEDALLPEGRKRQAGSTHFSLRFHLGDGVEAMVTAESGQAILRLDDGALWQFRCRGGTLAIEESLWIDGTGRPVATQQLVVTGETPAGGAHVSWAFKRAL
ncbi:heparinase II/III family protein [Sphingomonas sp. Marseille-Q8236]